MLKNKRTALCRVALEAGPILTKQLTPAPVHFLNDVRLAAFNRVALMRIVAIGAAHFPFEHRMAMWQLETGTDFCMTLEAGLGRAPGIDDRVRRAAALHVQTARAMTRFAADVLGVGALGF